MDQSPYSRFGNPMHREMEEARRRSSAISRREIQRIRTELFETRKIMARDKEILLRQIADLENLLRAKEREYSLRLKNADKDLIKDLLPVLDSLDAGSMSKEHAQVLKPFQDMILNILKKHGLQKIDTRGEKFDPFRHEVVGIVNDGEDGVVQDKVQDGYLVNDEVIRTAKVIVSKR